MSDTEKIFLELIQVAIGNRERLDKIPTEAQWSELYAIAVKQSLVGVAFSGVEKLYKTNESAKPPMPVFYEWIGHVSQIEKQNQKLDWAASQLKAIFGNGGLRSCVLKGQGLARLYPEPLRRQSGDIDLWVEGGRERILHYLKTNFFGTGKIVIHHVDARMIEGVETEIHFIPMWMYSPIHNHRLQKYFKSLQDEQFSNEDKDAGFCCPSATFNIVYVLAHIFHHLLDEGVGMRQIVDYYFVLRNIQDTKLTSYTDLFNHFGLLKFSKGVMWIEKECLGMDEKYLLVEPDEKTGRRIMDEVMLTGNFGQYDQQFSRTERESAVTRNKRKSVRWKELVQDYPSEVLCIPVWKLWHWCWRKYNRYV